MNKKNLTIKIFIILSLLSNLIIIPTYGQTPKTSQTKTPPEITPEKLRVNLTDTIPMNYLHTNSPETPQQLQFKNMVLELTTSRKMTMNINSDDQIRLQYFTMNIEHTQNMHINMHTTQNPPENLPEPINGVKKYLTIEPNNTEPIKATLKLYLEQEILEEKQVEPDQFTWCYWNGLASALLHRPS